MRIRVVDIPPEGEDLNFELPQEELNFRLAEDKRNAGKESVAPLIYKLTGNPKAKIHIQLEGSTVVITGEVEADYASQCSRCLEEVRRAVKAPIHMILKHTNSLAKVEAQEEDLNFGYYEGEEVDCDGFTADLLFLALPFSELCQDDCRGLCPSCGRNLNQGSCECKPEKFKDQRFKILEQIKIQ